MPKSKNWAYSDRDRMAHAFKKRENQMQKATATVDTKDLKGLRMPTKDIPLKHKVVVSLDKAPRKTGDVEILPWNVFLTRLWNNEFK